MKTRAGSRATLAVKATARTTSSHRAALTVRSSVVAPPGSTRRTDPVNPPPDLWIRTTAVRGAVGVKGSYPSKRVTAARRTCSPPHDSVPAARS